MDICFSPLPISASRYRIGEFSYPVRQDSLAILIPFPEQNYKISLLASPFKLNVRVIPLIHNLVICATILLLVVLILFSIQVWLCLFCSYILIVFTFWLLGYESQGRSWIAVHYWGYYLFRAAMGQGYRYLQNYINMVCKY